MVGNFYKPNSANYKSEKTECPLTFHASISKFEGMKDSSDLLNHGGGHIWSNKISKRCLLAHRDSSQWDILEGSKETKQEAFYKSHLDKLLKTPMLNNVEKMQVEMEIENDFDWNTEKHCP